MKKYIDAKKLKKKFYKEAEDATDLFDAFDYAMENTRAEDVAPVIHAHWIEEREDCFWIHEVNYKCSNCNQYAGNCGSFFPYCPHCGAEMKKEG